MQEETGRLAPKLGKRIRKLRDERETNQEELARLCGFHRSHMGQIERGESNLTLSTLIAVSKGLKVSLAKLFWRIS